MPFSFSTMKHWLSKINHWPKWVLALIALGVIGLGILVMDTLTGSNNQMSGAVDPYLNSTGQAFDVFLKLGLVVFLIYISSILFKRWRGVITGRPVRQLSVVETLHLGPRRSVHLIKAGDQIFLVGATDQALSLLKEIDPSALSDPKAENALPREATTVENLQVIEQSPKPTFSDMLSRVISKQ